MASGKCVARFSRHRRSAAGPTSVTSEDKRMSSTVFGLQKPVEGLTVVGEAAREAAPEIIEMFFDIHSAAATAVMATQENANRIMQIRQALTLACNGNVDLL